MTIRAVTKICTQCKESYISQSNNGKYCSVCRVRMQKIQSAESKKRQVKWRCIICGKRLKDYRNKFCRMCFKEYVRGENNPSWNGGQFINAKGYTVIWQSSRYIQESHIVWERTHGMKLPDNLILHHINGNTKDNRPSNLMAMTRSNHTILHWRFRKLRSVT